MNTRLKFSLVVAVILGLAPVPARAQRMMEKLNRGVVAMVQPDGNVYVSWRLLGTEPATTAFNVYRSAGGAAPAKLNPEPLTGPTLYVDKARDVTKPATYSVRTVVKGEEQPAQGSFTIAANAPALPYLSIPMQTPPGYAPNDASVGDLDGDGQYEIVIHQTGRGKDNSQNGETDPPILQAYRLDGTKMWEINLGKNIREGAHYTQFMVYDLDGDGKAEVACKTGDGTTDGKGKVIGDPKANWVDQSGRILRGPEFLTVFNGETGAELATTKFIPARHPTTDDPSGNQLKDIWGDGYGNRNDRFLGGIAYLDGKRPSLIMSRGYYTRTVISAWNWREGQLSKVWTFDSDESPANKKYAGQGNHQLSIADVDGDGKDEIIYGGMCLDDNGKGLYTTGLGHGDAMHVSDLDPSRPGLEVFRIQERFDNAGSHMFDAATGKVLWKKPSVAKGGDGEGPGRGLSMDIDPRFKGAECWSFGAGISGLYDCKGGLITKTTPPTCNFGVWWDGDLLREALDRNAISKWDWQKSTLNRMLVAEGCMSNNGTKATPALSADILGDWREEVIWRTEDNKELRIYTTTIPTNYRMPTLMHDPEYRLSIAWQNVAYNQPPHTSFYLGEGMAAPPHPNIVTSLGALLTPQNAFLVVTPPNAPAELARVKSAAVQGEKVVAELADGNPASWDRKVVTAQLPVYTAEELKVGAGGAPLLASYDAIAKAHPTLKTQLDEEVAPLRAFEQAQQAKNAAGAKKDAGVETTPGAHP